MRKRQMNDELLARIEREVLGWDGVFKKRDEHGPGGIGVTGYRYGDPESGGPQIGHPRRRPPTSGPQRGQGRVDPHREGDPSSRVSGQPDDGELQGQKRGRCGRSPGAVPHELRT